MPRPFFSHFYHFPVSEISDRFLIWCLLCLATTNQINWRPWTVIEGYWKFGLHWSFDDKCIWEYKINLWTFSLWTKVTKAVNIKHVYLKCKIWSVPKQYIVFSPLLCFPLIFTRMKKPFCCPLADGYFQVQDPLYFHLYFQPKVFNSLLMLMFPGAGLYPSKIGGEAGGGVHPAAPCTPYFSSSMQSAYGPQGNFSKLKFPEISVWLS